MMKYRALGKTGLDISEIVFGGGWVGGILIHQDDDTKLRAIRTALDGGVNWIDTAPSYGQGKSEEALGWLLREVEQSPSLSTKVGLDLARLDDIAGQVERSLHESLTRLGRESVALLQLHNAIAAETDGQHIGVTDVLRTADALDRMREQKLIRHVGFTALGEAAAIREVLAGERFDTAQVYYNLLNPSAGRPMPPGWTGHDFAGVIAACRKHGVGVMNIRVFAAGVIATDERTGREVILTEDTALADEERRARAVFKALGEAYGTRAQTAIRFSLANPDIACVVVGLVELGHLDEALGAADMGPLPDEALRRLDALYESDFGRA